MTSSCPSWESMVQTGPIASRFRSSGAYGNPPVPGSCTRPCSGTPMWCNGSVIGCNEAGVESPRAARAANIVCIWPRAIERLQPTIDNIALPTNKAIQAGT